MPQTISANVSGIVQGVGFRVCVKQIALNLSLTGRVKNLSDGRVQIIVTGEKEILDNFFLRLYKCPRAQVNDIASEEIEPQNFESFEIIS